MIEGVEFSGFHSEVWPAGLEVNRKRFIGCPSASDLTRKYRVFRKKLSFPQTLESDINHIISKQNAAESIYCKTAISCKVLKGSRSRAPQAGVFPVPTQTVFLFRQAQATAPRVSSRPATMTSNVVSICDSPAFSAVVEPETDEPERDGLGCARAIRAAFVLEGGLGLLLYGLWHFRHVILAIHLIHLN